MPSQPDAFGHALADFYNGKDVNEIIEREDGYIDISAGPKMYFAPFEEWAPHQQRAMRFVRGRVLDIGCGAGRHSLYLQSQGHEVVGIDVSPKAIEVCRARGMKDARLLPITQASVRSLGNFDTIIMLGNNFGLVGNPTRARWLLRRFGNMLSREGRIIAESANHRSTNNPDHLAYQAYNVQRGRMPAQLRIRVRYRALKGVWFEYLLATQEEMQEILSGTGWRVSEFITSDEDVNYVAVIECSL
jgi:cyclopropane fatty-acyl-phospholipid synthase-like methyltransferase